MKENYPEVLKMPNLYVITGPAGIGKSTVSKKLTERLNKSSLIEGDEIYHQVIGGFVPAWKEGNHLDIFWEICLDTINTYLTYGYDVIFNYIVTLKDLKRIKDKFKNYIVKFVLLVASEETLLLRDKSRPEDCQMHERCIILLNNFKKENYAVNNILDTTNLSIDETVDIIQNTDSFILK